MGRTPAAVGRDAVVAALVEAAAEEMAERGPEAASVRAIARRAGVNHGLVHRHFRSKEALLAAVLDHLAAEVASGFDAEGPPALRGPATERFLRVVARALLDGVDVARLQVRHPVMDRLVPAIAGRTGLADASARLVAAEGIALQLGWLLFEPFIAGALGLDRAGRRRAAERIDERLRTMA